MVRINEEQKKRLMELVFMLEEDFYEEFLKDAPLEELATFLKELPDFMEAGEEFELDSEEMLRKIQEHVEK